MALPMIWPAAYSPTGASGQLKCAPEDFVVDELPAVVPAGEGEHLFLQIRKRGLTTGHVASLIAGAARVPPEDVSYAGTKDRVAVATQWFSVRLPGRDDLAVEFDAVTELDRARHTHKLRRGQLEGNAFQIRLRSIQGSASAIDARLRQLATSGFPNYFGPQRFGRDNWDQALEWLAMPRQRRSRINRGKRALHMSTLRSGIFNAVLAARVSDGTWGETIAGDVVVGGMPTGPLWGRGRTATEGRAGEIEAGALRDYAEILEQLEFLGLKQDRRALRVLPVDLTWRFDADDLYLEFVLPPGAYAVVAIGEAVQTVSNEATETSDGKLVSEADVTPGAEAASA